MAEITENCSRGDDTHFIFSNQHLNARFPIPSNSAASTIPEVNFTSTPTSPTFLCSPPSTNEQVSPKSISTTEASNNETALEVLSTAGVHFLANNSIDDHRELSTANSIQCGASLILSRPNPFKLGAESSNSVHSRQHREEYFASKPTEIMRPRVNSRLRYGQKPESDSWKNIFWDNQRNELTIQNSSFPPQRLVVPQQAVTVLTH